jgi:hypothetical protein
MPTASTTHSTDCRASPPARRLRLPSSAWHMSTSACSQYPARPSAKCRRRPACARSRRCAGRSGSAGAYPSRRAPCGGSIRRGDLDRPRVCPAVPPDDVGKASEEFIARSGAATSLRRSIWTTSLRTSRSGRCGHATDLRGLTLLRGFRLNEPPISGNPISSDCFCAAGNLGL